MPFRSMAVPHGLVATPREALWGAAATGRHPGLARGRNLVQQTRHDVAESPCPRKGARRTVPPLGAPPGRWGEIEQRPKSGLWWEQRPARNRTEG